MSATCLPMSAAQPRRRELAFVVALGVAKGVDRFEREFASITSGRWSGRKITQSGRLAVRRA
jgi:hypothetical protein